MYSRTISNNVLYSADQPIETTDADDAVSTWSPNDHARLPIGSRQRTATIAPPGGPEATDLVGSIAAHRRPGNLLCNPLPLVTDVLWPLTLRLPSQLIQAQNNSLLTSTPAFNPMHNAQVHKNLFMKSSCESRLVSKLVSRLVSKLVIG